jgi:hypothetical protein
MATEVKEDVLFILRRTGALFQNPRRALSNTPRAPLSRPTASENQNERMTLSINDGRLSGFEPDISVAE